ncbi:hypothetical protein [Alicyclobacillus fastidiosus]|uniref:DUF4115 domain-containing protein n=1 Tax=Alicyclobacillus fastidiosus TaxID=392011 RepID=A0ABV5AAH2_9BACL|nr:hypothetical protein [Alicyclobacillus fastidiosus]WEH07590.1 hypothetical protein PYS47_12495 [Alicyclobacillus fastidiosus]
MTKRKLDAPPTNFLVGLGTTHKVTIQNPTNTANAPILKANPTTAANIVIRANSFVRVVLQGNTREPEIIVGAAPNGLFFQRTVTLRPGQSVTLQAGTFSRQFSVKK